MSQPVLLRSRRKEVEFSRETVLDVLSNQRRRSALHILKRDDSEPQQIQDIATQIAAWENGKPPVDVSYQERKRVQNALRQYHLPKLVEEGFVEYDQVRGLVKLTNSAANYRFYVDVLPKRGIPWGVYYLIFSTIGLLCFIGLFTGTAPITWLSPLYWGLFFIVIFWISSLAHVYDNYLLMRFGVGEQPLGIDES